jgi:TPR repeat protein
MKAAEGGYVRAMYNISLCYSVGEGLSRNHQVARKWMKRAADRGHSKAQFEHGLALYSVSVYPFMKTGHHCTFFESIFLPHFCISSALVLLNISWLH